MGGDPPQSFNRRRSCRLVAGRRRAGVGGDRRRGSRLSGGGRTGAGDAAVRQRRLAGADGEIEGNDRPEGQGVVPALAPCAHRPRPRPRNGGAASPHRQGSRASKAGRSDRVAFGTGYSDRKSVVSGKSVSVRVDLGGRRSIKKKTEAHHSIFRTVG